MNQANVYLLYQLDGWHVVIKYDEGHEVISHEAYETKEECKAAFDQWCKDTGTEMVKPQ